MLNALRWEGFWTHLSSDLASLGQSGGCDSCSAAFYKWKKSRTHLGHPSLSRSSRDGSGRASLLAVNKTRSSVIYRASSPGCHGATGGGGKSRLLTRGSSSSAPGRSLLLARSGSQPRVLKEAIPGRKSSEMEEPRSHLVSQQQPGEGEARSALYLLYGGVGANISLFWPEATSGRFGSAG